MASTNFVDGQTVTSADWYNDLDRLHYDILGDPADAAAVRTALGLSASGKVLQVVEGTPYTSNTALSTLIPLDNTIPQNTEGTELITVAITPTAATSTLIIEADGMFGSSAALHCMMAFFVDTTADAIAANATAYGVAGRAAPVGLTHIVSAASTTARTYKLRVGPNTGIVYTNSNTSSARFGGVAAIRMRVWEIAA